MRDSCVSVSVLVAAAAAAAVARVGGRQRLRVVCLAAGLSYHLLERQRSGTIDLQVVRLVDYQKVRVLERNPAHRRSVRVIEELC